MHSLIPFSPLWLCNSLALFHFCTAAKCWSGPLWLLSNKASQLLSSDKLENTVAAERVEIILQHGCTMVGKRSSRYWWTSNQEPAAVGQQFILTLQWQQSEWAIYVFSAFEYWLGGKGDQTCTEIIIIVASFWSAPLEKTPQKTKDSTISGLKRDNY